MGFYQSQDPNVLGLFGQGVGQAVQQGAQRQKEQDALQSILSKMGQGEDILQTILGSQLPIGQQQDLLNTIGQFQERSGKSKTADMNAFTKLQQEQQDLSVINQQLEERGLQPLPPGTSSQLARDILKQSQPKDATKQDEKVRNLEGAKERLNKMREIRSRGNLGAWVKGKTHLLGGKTARDKGQYEQLGKSLISLATNIPIRNRLEFETLADRLFDASISDSEAEGVLDGMEEIIEDSMYEVRGGKDQVLGVVEQENISDQGKELTADVMQVIFKRANGDKEQARKIAKQMGYKLG